MYLPSLLEIKTFELQVENVNEMAHKNTVGRRFNGQKISILKEKFSTCSCRKLIFIFLTDVFSDVYKLLNVHYSNILFILIHYNNILIHPVHCKFIINICF
jgi:hypothetical protein